jgi:hypothetical protein
MEHLMKNKVKVIILTLGFALTANAQQFNGTVVDLDGGRIQVIQGEVTDRDRAFRERQARYEQMSAELSASINAMRAQSEMRRQTAELEEQTRLLRKIADQ